ncbi:MAG: tRNA (adenosine(37)-N6)-threonylcarbamoyltransferase complex transferase subunit TsaD [Alphaproteobacteria bacterium]|nr:tRNA (adenosine(37)-N6)-threonylcarbamoyltransferase complex transferase subunit TsaD [Alphaproteobacteria bacterium]QQS57174.1 MAG: tRNA (adenosine(37)-N6)-threonylcarbamoyltransferase complex transferase subunit TsaD [Alphaproteobacteria bacterium]
MIVLGIETSCDETAAAIVTDKREILSNIVLRQLEEHALYGGVVPEIAARTHLEHLDRIVRIALQEAKIEVNDLDAVAATCGPGLIGGVLVGMMTAKAMASALKIPFLAINHLEGHALTPRLTDNIEFPYLILLVSGGHTQILVAEDVGLYRRWGTTLDDAAGECFDKSAKLLGLPWPGGPRVEEYAAKCTNGEKALRRFPLPRPMQHHKSCDFSFSGLKSAVRVHVDSLSSAPFSEQDLSDLCFSLQTAISETLASRCRHAMQRFKDTYGQKTSDPVLVVAGGVSANRTIRSTLENLCAEHGMRLSAAPLELCTDNAAMIAWAGIERLQKGLTDPLDFKARPRWPLDPAAEPKIGAGVKA